MALLVFPQIPAGVPAEEKTPMKFGYFTLSDNRYPDNPRSPEQFLLEIRDQAVLAERIGLNSAWIGEHHFNRRGVVSMPGLVLANVAAVTKHLRLAPAVVGAATTATSSHRSTPTSRNPPSSSRRASSS
jgi:hypothetical protein